MNGDRGISLMVKPQSCARAELNSQPWSDDKRDAGLTHETVLPIGDRRVVGPYLDRIMAAMENLDAVPFEACFDKAVATTGFAAKLVSSGKQPEQRRLFRSALASVRRSGFVVPEYRFSPHVTLHYRWPGPAIKQDIEPIRWLVDTLLLVESFHGEARHEELHRWPLRPRQGTLFPFLSCTMPAARAA